MREYTVVTSAEMLEGIAAEIMSAEAIALDLETARIGGGPSTDPLTGRIRICSINTGKGRYVIDLYATGTLGPVAEALRTTNAVVVGQNLKFDQKWLLWHYGLEFRRVFDTFRASNILYAGLPKLEHDLYALYKRELNEKPEVEELGGSDWDAPELTKAQLDYAADDIDKLLRLRAVLKPKIVAAGLTKIAQLEFGAILPEAAIELNGFYLDQSLWRHRVMQDEARARALKAVLLDALPNPNAQLALPGLQASEANTFNIDSPAQVLKAFQRLGIQQNVKDPETHAVSRVLIQDTKEMTLAMEAENFPVLEKFIEYRGYAQSVKTFGNDYLKNVHPVSQRIHCSFYPYTDAGRYACVAPWTPVRTSEGIKPLRAVHIGDKVWTHKERWRDVTAFLPQGVQDTYNVRFSNGDVLTCTASHRLLLSDGNWKYVGVMASEWLQESEEQRSGQSRASHNAGTPSYSLFAGEGQPSLSITEIHFAGSIEVYDLTVDEDESYQTYSVFSHNCSKPNLQQIPRGKAFRECFRAEPGRKLAICDWSNIEMRLVAEISQDKTLIKVFQDKRDAHYATASLLSGIPEKEVPKDKRQQAKPVNFGFIYGMQAARLVLYAKAGYGVSLTEGQAKKFRKKFFEAYEGIASWHNFAQDSGKRRGETRTIWGRRRLIRDEKAHNEFFNSPVQGSGADGLKNTLRLLYDRLKDLNDGKPPLLAKGARVGPVHMVHDEIILEHVDEPGFDETVQTLLHTAMIDGMAPMMKRVPTEAECGGGESWAAK